MVFVTATLPAAAADPRASEKTAPTFYKDVLALLQDHCQSCHRPGEVAPMPLVTYEQIRPWAPAIATSVKTGMMPPWFADPRFGHFSNDPSLTPQQIATVLAWVEGGTPAGNPEDAPPAPQWAEGWNIAKPDVVLPMPKPVAIPADGEVEYTYEIAPTHFSEDKWIQMT
jgi:mono/diheme cytochrome c family protein